MRFQVDEKNKEINQVQRQIGEKKKAKEPCDDLLAEKVALEEARKKIEVVLEEKQAELRKRLISMGNIVASDVIDSMDEANNGMVRFWPEEYKEGTQDPTKFHHFEVLHMIDGVDTERGQNIAGHRGYFLKNWGVLLNQALINYGIAFTRKRGYTPLQTPFFMRKDVMAETAQLEQFDEELYKVVAGDGNDKYLIATSEQPISAYHRGEWLEPKDLPLRYTGISTCFRKEAGAHGKDTLGIFRVHQFEKVEQFVFSKPEESWQMFDEMVGTAEAFYQSLNIPYRVVSIVSGALNNAAAKKYDVEAWFPGFGTSDSL